MSFRLYVTIFIYLAFMTSAHINNSSKDDIKSVKLPPCAACKLLTDSFKKGIERTERGKFEGGDTAWEEKNMGSYRNSEVRLIEIQESLCSEIERGKEQCHANAEEHEMLIEDWWFALQDSDPDIYSWLCINKLKTCCPEFHYGPTCLPCKGEPRKPCGGNGKCKGDGTRKGSGECLCFPGYEGELCQSCSVGYFEAYRDDKKNLCEQCHRACLGPCSGAGTKACIACHQGWVMDTELGCLDIDECTLEKTSCNENEFCANNEGSYACLKCDRSCNGCTGQGPDMCKSCTDGYAEDKETGICKDNSAEQREKYMTFGRYVTYGGLTLATCIIFQRETVIAAFVGLSVAIYISFAEYYLTHIDNSGGNSVPKSTVSADPLFSN